MIKVENLSKSFKINKPATGLMGTLKSLVSNTHEIKDVVKDISFEIDEGEIVGFLGPNGAGKSTTIKMMTGILYPTSGRCVANNLVPYENRIENAKNIGVVFGQRTQLWWDLPLADTFLILKKIYHVSDSDYEFRYKKLNEFLDIRSFADQTVRTLSLGQRMRADLAASLLHNPKILYLDEPTIGLDIIVKDNMIATLKELQKEFNTTIVLTTHDMSDIERLCKRVIIIDKGSLIYNDSIAGLKQKYGSMGSLEIKCENTTDLNKDSFSKLQDEYNITCNVNIEENSLHIEYNKDKQDIVNLINVFHEYVKIKDIVVKDIAIEDVIKKIYL